MKFVQFLKVIQGVKIHEFVINTIALERIILWFSMENLLFYSIDTIQKPITYIEKFWTFFCLLWRLCTKILFIFWGFWRQGYAFSIINFVFYWMTGFFNQWPKRGSFLLSCTFIRHQIFLINISIGWKLFMNWIWFVFVKLYLDLRLR